MIVLKILLFILLAVLGIIILALLMPVSVKGSYIEGKVSYGVKYAFINLLDSNGKGLAAKFLNKKKNPEKDKSDDKEKKSDNKADSPEKEEASPVKDEDKKKKKDKAEDKPSAEEVNPDSTENTEEDSENPKKKKKSLGELFELVSGIWLSAKRPLRKILKGFHFSDFYIDFLIANEDAYKCALNYGRISGAVYNLIAQMSILFTVKLKTIDITPGFAQEKNRWDAGVKLRFIPMTAVISGIWFLITYIFRVYLPQKRAAKKATVEAAKTKKESVPEV